ncbi:MAG: HAMP domain-containing histidine kinase [Lachnospiraceae bacterium]|nr:HAMP domain-containing histidine kinase [Lachnospiraceae bacterium]
MRFRTKIAVCMMLFFSLSFGLGGSLLIAVSFEANMNQEKERAVSSWRMICGTLSVVNQVSEQAYYGNVVDVLEQLEAAGGGGWEALRLRIDGTVFYESGSAAEALNPSLVSEGADICRLLVFAEEEAHYLQVAGTLEAGGKTLVLDSLYDITSIYESRAEQLRLYRVIFLLLAAMGFALSWILANLVTRPVHDLSRTARQIAGGDLSVRASVRGEDEIGRLAEDFNRMTDELEKRVEELEEAVMRREAFMGGFAHELKSPMTSVIGYADLLRSRELPEEKRREAAQYIFSEGKRLERLSRKLLELLLMKQEPPALVPGRPAEIAAGVCERMRPSLTARGIALTCEGEEGTCLLEPSLVDSLLVNLIDNAAKSMDGAGRIAVAASLTAEGCLLTVTDEGRGIPPEERERITDAFYRVDKSRSRAQGGVGLGLALCREIAGLHGGTISFENNVPRGTRVTVCLKGGVLA